MMQEAVLKAVGRFDVIEAAASVPGPGEALVRITAVGVCGSDLHMFSEGVIGGISIDDAGGPFVPGHEAAGVVEDVGAGVEKSLVGKRVAIEPAINCGVCQWCLGGQPNVCPHHDFLGLPPTGGALRQYMTHPARLCEPVGDELTDDEIVLLEPLAIAIHAVDRVGFACGQGAVVLGAGPIGLSIVAVLAGSGCGPIIVSDKLDYRLEWARKFGATHTLNPMCDDVPAAVEELSGGHGLPHVFEAAGDSQTFMQMIHCAAPGGTVAVVGIPAEDRLAFQHSVARRKGLDVLMIRRSNLTLHRAIRWAHRPELPVRQLASHHWPLARTQQAYQTAANYADGVLKAMVNP